jgi:glycosyltransferase involved in cell wall biosynthesis
MRISQHKKIVIVSFEHNMAHLPLQPWKFIHEMAKNLSKTNSVHIITNGECNRYTLDGVPIIIVKSLSPFRIGMLQTQINMIGPDLLIWWSSPRSIFYLKLFKRLSDCKICLLYSGPLYQKNEILPVLHKMELRNFMKYLVEVLTPHYFINRLVNNTSVKFVMTISDRNRKRLLEIGCPESKLISIGTGKEDERLVDHISIKENRINLLYVTAASKIRGIFFLLDVFKKLTLIKTDLTLIILARPSEGNQILKLQRRIVKLGLTTNVKVIEGWMSKEQILKYMSESRVLVMPFQLLPSEMPLSIFESFSVGTPVIAPDLGGLHQIVDTRGMTYKHYSKQSLFEAIMIIINDHSAYNLYSKNALKFSRNMPLWSELNFQPILV